MSLNYDTIYHIIKFLDFETTINFLKSLDITPTTNFIRCSKNKLVVEHIYDEYFSKGGVHAPQLTSNLNILLRLMKPLIDLEDLICLMANFYPKKINITKTLLYNLLKMYPSTSIDWTLIKTHFKIDFNHKKYKKINNRARNGVRRRPTRKFN